MPIAAEDLRDARLAMAMSQTDFSRALGVSTRTIGNWETSGVPERAERQVMRVFGRTILAVRREREQEAEYQAWLETDEGKASLEQQWERHQAREHDRFVPVTMHGRDVQRVEEVQQALAAMDTLDLLHELIRRHQADGKSDWTTARVAASVGDHGDDEDEDFDVETDVKQDMGLAAKRGQRKVDQPYAE
jgi:transcriptional regulator with XRE-family HTH domain